MRGRGRRADPAVGQAARVLGLFQPRPGVLGLLAGAGDRRHRLRSQVDLPQQVVFGVGDVERLAEQRAALRDD